MRIEDFKVQERHVETASIAVHTEIHSFIY
jgi:hypothetical protein